MDKKNIASPRIPAKEGNGVFHTSSKGKDSYFLRTDKKMVFVKDQKAKLQVAFSLQILTRFQASIVTGIGLSSVCPFVARQKRHNSIWSCGRRIDLLTGRKSEFLTMNREIAVEYYKGETEGIWRDLSEEKMHTIFKAMDSYLDRRDFGVFISSSLVDDDVREVWLKIQDFIDCQNAEIRNANAERRKSIYQDL